LISSTSRIWNFWSLNRGSAAVEFAMIAPILLTLLAGIVEGGHVIQTYKSVNALATQYALVWADCSDEPAGTCLTELNTLSASNTIANSFPTLTASALTLQAFQVQMSGANPTIIYVYPLGSTLSPTQVTAASNAIQAGQSGVLVSLTYNDPLDFFPTIMNTFFGAYLTPSFTVVQQKS